MEKTVWRHQREESEVGLYSRIPTPKPAPSPQGNKKQVRLKMEDIIPHLPSVNEICTPLAEQILADHKKGDTSSSEGVALLLNTRMTTLLQHQPVRTTQRTKIKLLAHRNEEQRESKAQIVTLQKALDKTLHRANLSISAETSFTIMDL